jgi:hypothetical protein
MQPYLRLHRQSRRRDLREGPLVRQTLSTLVHAHIQMEFPVRLRQVPVLEEKEFDLPQPDPGYRERVGTRPVRAVCEGGVEPGPGRAVQLNGLVRPCGRVLDDSHANQIDPRRVIHRLRGECRWRPGGLQSATHRWFFVPGVSERNIRKDNCAARRSPHPQAGLRILPLTAGQGKETTTWNPERKPAP